MPPGICLWGRTCLSCARATGRCLSDTICSRRRCLKSNLTVVQMFQWGCFNKNVSHVFIPLFAYLRFYKVSCLHQKMSWCSIETPNPNHKMQRVWKSSRFWWFWCHFTRVCPWIHRIAFHLHFWKISRKPEIFETRKTHRLLKAYQFQPPWKRWINIP